MLLAVGEILCLEKIDGIGGYGIFLVIFNISGAHLTH